MTMLSNNISVADQRRRTHRRQNSTPVTEMPLIPAAHPGLQRAQQLRAHRRGLSLDQRPTYQLHQHHKLIPTLGPISQDDFSVGHTNPGDTTHPQHPMQFAQHSDLVQPGHFHNNLEAQFQLQPQLTPCLDPGQQVFFPLPDQHQAFMHHPASSPLAMQHPSFQHQPQIAVQPVDDNPAQSRFDAAKRQIEACFPGAHINIQVLPTPVATPQKRAAASSPEKLDVSPIPFTLHEAPGFRLDGRQPLQPMFEVSELEASFQHGGPGPVFDQHIHSPIAISPTRSLISSPLHAVMSPSQASTLIEVEGDPSSALGSPVNANPISFADLSVTDMKGAFITTGVAPQEVDSFISPQDPETRKYYCMYEGCGKGEGFGRRENIRAHVQTHLNDRAYKCLVCGSAFVRMNDLKRHSKIHKSVKEFQCECGSMFARHDALTRHKQRGCCSVHSSPLKPGKKKPGRPKKHRPEMDDRVSKSAKQRQLNASRAAYDGSSGASSGDESEFSSPSPQMRPVEFSSFDCAPLDSSQIDGVAHRRSASPPSQEEQTADLSFASYTINPTDISVNTTFDMSTLDNSQPYTPVDTDFQTSIMKLLSTGTPVSQTPTATLLASSTPTAATTTTGMPSSLGGLGISHATPPPDTPEVNAKLQRMQHDLSRASPAHSLSNSLSTPPSSPPEQLLLHHHQHNNHPNYLLLEDDVSNRFWDFMQPVATHVDSSNGGGAGCGKPMRDHDWDEVDSDLFGEELPSASSGVRDVDDDFFGLTYS